MSLYSYPNPFQTRSKIQRLDPLVPVSLHSTFHTSPTVTRTSTKAFHLRCQRAAIYQPHKHVIETRSSHERGNSRREQFARVEACAGRGVPENLVRADGTKRKRKYETSTHRKCSIRTQPFARTWASEHAACSCVANAFDPIPSRLDNHNHVLCGDEKLADYLQVRAVVGRSGRTT